MASRSESLFRVFLTLLAALLLGAVLEVDGLRIWAERLGMGPLRELAVPATRTWQAWLQPFGQARAMALQAKAEWAPVMLGAAATKPVVSALERAGELPMSVDLAMRLPQQPLPTWTDVAAPAPLVTTVPLLPAEALSLASAAEGSVQIVLAGDSMMAVGLAPTLRRGLAAETGVHLLKAYRSGTGLARPEVFDWLQQYPPMLGAARPQLVICALGANDGQNVQVGKDVLAFGSPAWDAFYLGRLTAYLDMLLKPRTHVLWIGMPVMKERRFAQKMQHMNELTRAALARYPQVTWLDPNPLLGYAGEVFAQYRADEHGKLIKLRADDGIHLTDDGAAYLLEPIRAWVGREVAATGATPAEAVSLQSRVVSVRPAEAGASL